MSYTVKVIDSITKIDRNTWESFFQNPFYSYDWLRMLEISQPVRVLPRHLIAYQNGQISAIIPCFLQHEEMYVTVEDRLFGRFKSWARLLGVRTIPALLAYAPLSIYTEIGLHPSVDQREMVGELLSTMKQVASEEGASLYGFMYLSGKEALFSQILKENGFFGSFIVPAAYLDISWDTFEAYTRHLGQNMAKNIRREIRQNLEAGIKIEEVTDFEPLAEEFARIFGQLFNRFKEKNCPFTPAFFRELPLRCPGMMTSFCAFQGEKLRGFSIVLKDRDIWRVVLASQDHTNFKKDNTFFDVAFYTPVRESIKQGVKRIYYGTENYETKLRRGCQLDPLFMWLRSPQKKINLLLPMWMRVLDLWYQKNYGSFLEEK